MNSIEEIRAAWLDLKRAIDLPEHPDSETAMVTAAIDELATLRPSGEGHYPTRAELHAQIDEMKARVVELEALAYIGEHHFPDLTWKARAAELVSDLRNAERQRDDLREKADAAVKAREMDNANARVLIEAGARDITSLREQVATLTQERDFARKEFNTQLQATWNRIEERDAAKAELASLRETRIIEERETKAMVDAAKADAARLREGFCETMRGVRSLVERDENEYAINSIDSELIAVNTTDSAAWLESKIAERTAELTADFERQKENAVEKVRSMHADLTERLADAEKRCEGAWANRERFCTEINVIGHEVLGFKAENCAPDAVSRETKFLVTSLRERSSSLEQQLVAATNDAARAELRARDLRMALEREVTRHSVLPCNQQTLHVCAATERAKSCAALAASPDSDERLREVMLKVAERAHDVIWNADEPVLKSEMSEIVDEVLGVKS